MTLGEELRRKYALTSLKAKGELLALLAIKEALEIAAGIADQENSPVVASRIRSLKRSDNSIASAERYWRSVAPTLLKLRQSFRSNSGIRFWESVSFVPIVTLPLIGQGHTPTYFPSPGVALQSVSGEARMGTSHRNH
jgi:hypothetical protein